MQVFTLVLWLACLAIGLLGLWFGPTASLPSPALPTTEPAPLQVEMLDMELAPAPTLQAMQSSPIAPTEREARSPDIPPLPAVAAPSPALAFAIPVEGAVRVVSSDRAAHGRPAAPARIEQLVFGQGSTAGQPRPEYPPEAIADGESGVVGVQFTAGPDGRVVEAHVARPSRWPLLNEAAVRVIRQRWANPQWADRTCDVSIVFSFNQ